VTRKTITVKMLGSSGKWVKGTGLTVAEATANAAAKANAKSEGKSPTRRKRNSK